jgi:hypothetical protein
MAMSRSLWEWCGHEGPLLAVGIFESSELHQRFILLLRLRDGCGLRGPFGDFPSTTNNVRPAPGGAVVAAGRRHGLEVKDEGHLKDSDVIFIFIEVFCTIRCLF